MSQGDPSRSIKYLQRRAIVPINLEEEVRQSISFYEQRAARTGQLDLSASLRGLSGQIAEHGVGVTDALEKLNRAVQLAKPIDEEPGRQSLRLGLTAGEVDQLTQNVQGDVYVMFPKRFERFIFFRISDAAKFRGGLAKYLDANTGYVTSAKQTIRNIQGINDKSRGSNDIVSSQIAFSKAGLVYLGVTADVGDPHFDGGSMRREKFILGDRGIWDDVFERANTPSNGVHGVMLVTAKAQQTCQTKASEIIDLFRGALEGTPVVMEGRVREGEAEFFGFRDGVSQPALEGLIQPHRGQRIVKPGVLIMGYEGDPVPNRPKWTKDGSFMVFRKLEQNVLAFEKYVDDNYRIIPSNEPGDGSYLTTKQRKDLFAARLIGRFKSGAPLALTPYRDDLQFTHPERINDFDFSGDNEGRPPNCPFFAHIRKTEPRNLTPLVTKEYLDASVIVRSGIPYGVELTADERRKWKDAPWDPNYKVDRGLHFVCYQSSIDNGFYRQTVHFANNDYFPTTHVAAQKHGQDPIIGGPPDFVDGAAPIAGQGIVKAFLRNNNTGKTYEVTGFAKAGQYSAQDIVDGTAPITNTGEVTVVLSSGNKEYQVSGVAKDPNVRERKEDFFVTSRGGEYFFVPSIDTAWDIADGETLN